MHSEALYREAVDAAGIGVFERDYRTGRAMWSAPVWRLFGLEPGGEPPSEAEVVSRFIHPDDLPERNRLLAEAIARPGQARHEFEFRVIGADGVTRELMTVATVRRGADGQVISVHGVYFDISRRRQAERAEAESAALFSRAAEVAGLCAFDYDFAAGGTRWSAHIWLIIGLPARDDGPTDAEICDCVHPDDAAALAARQAAMHGDPACAKGEAGWRILRPDGAVRHVLATVSYVRNESGVPVRAYGIVQDVTDQREAEAAVRASETRFRLASEIAGLGVYERDRRTGRATWSDRMWDIMGLPPGDGVPGWDVIASRIQSDDLAVYNNALLAAGSVPVSISYQYRRPDDSLRRIEERFVVERDAQGAPVVVRGVIADVTDHKLAEEALRSGEARFRLAAEAAGFGVFDRTEDGGSMWSRRTWEIYGLQPSATIPDLEALEAITHPADRARRRQFFANMWASPDGALRAGSFRVMWPDGSVRHIVINVLLVRREGDAKARVHGVVMDVTDRVRAQEALVAEKERFRHAVDAGGMGVFERDLLTGAGTWSEREWRIFGLQPCEAAPSDADVLARVHPDDRHLALAMRERMADAPSGTPIRSEFRIVRADGAVRQLVSDLVVVRDGAGRALRVHGVESDVTEEREVRAQAMISANLATLGQMATGIAHELGQPLQAIGAAAGTVNAWVSAGAQMAQAQIAMRELERIELQAERAGKTMRHLLLLGRGGRSDGLTSLSDVIEGALDLVGISIRGSGVRIEADVPDGLPRVRGGQIELEKVLINLLLNAHDAIEGLAERRITLRAWCDTGLDGQVVMLEVGDTGPGVPLALRSRLFEPFFTTKEVGRGTGLGLSICRTTMAACGGGIALAARGPGAHFVLRFAVADEAGASPSGASYQGSQSATLGMSLFPRAAAHQPGAHTETL